MKRWLEFLAIIVAFACAASGYAEPAEVYGVEMYSAENGNVIFNATVYGTNIGKLPVYKVMLMPYDQTKDAERIEIFGNVLFEDHPELHEADVRLDEDGRIMSRSYLTLCEDESRRYGCSFSDGCIGANTYEATFYPGVMDIWSMLHFDRAVYIPEKTTCADLPMMPVVGVVEDFQRLLQELEISTPEIPTEGSPYVLRAYSLDENICTQAGVYPFMQVIIQGNDLTAENREMIRRYGPNCYMIAFRYNLGGVPVSYESYYIESRDYATLGSRINALYNDRGFIQFYAWNQFLIVESSEACPILTVEEAAEQVANYLNPLLGMPRFVCREIRLEYLPLAYDGCDVTKEAQLTPVWIFLFEDQSSVSILVNALDGSVIQ